MGAPAWAGWAGWLSRPREVRARWARLQPVEAEREGVGLGVAGQRRERRGFSKFLSFSFILKLFLNFQSMLLNQINQMHGHVCSNMLLPYDEF